MPQPLRSVCVFCGSRTGDDPVYAEAATAVGRALAESGWRLVYGAGEVGMMGRVAAAARDAGGQRLGVIPVHLLEREAPGRDLRQCVVTENMHERKKVMFMNADAIVTLPGGPGSLDEFFEVMTWRQLGLHEKPIYLLNIGGYWDPLVALIDNIISQGFADPGFRDYMRVVPDVATLTARLRADLS
ncbi:TIGR00730 family Rossman fold protein [Maritimibacter sp. 55A14]|uniref:LOG family protein n=1 Tax=Maritimibacter sp. 55A14 TaxID=2174844 RepID=UPI000D60DE0E|nr:TIGR00730 family Rossman fold protein [Maritimibacter sp. 55A14]PWE33907.1 TIGR00730 family Rossman fold protein [Maritimibacter sp. 55A14]